MYTHTHTHTHTEREREREGVCVFVYVYVLVMLVLQQCESNPRFFHSVFAMLGIGKSKLSQTLAHSQPSNRGTWKSEAG